MKPLTRIALATAATAGIVDFSIGAHAETPPASNIGTPVILRDPSLTHQYRVPMIANGEFVAVSNNTENAITGMSYLEQGDRIASPDVFIKLYTGTYSNTEQFGEIVRQIKGKDAQVPGFDPKTQEAFVAVVGAENPSLKFDRVADKEGKRTVELTYNSTSVDAHYAPDGLSHYIIGVTDRSTQVSVSYKGAAEPFLTIPAPTR